MEINKESFGELTTGEPVVKYKLSSDYLQVNLLNYGGIITGIYAPDRNGKRENVVLGFDNLADYEHKSPYFGAIIGRHAGRIANGEFALDGQTYKLAQNENNNNLHGGEEGLDKKIWTVKELAAGLELSYTSPHLEAGFPGQIDFTVRYLLKDNKLIIEYTGEPDRETIINLTNHTYFNLSGATKKDILDHKLMIKADQFLALDQQFIPTGETINAAGTPFDFRELKKIGEEIEADYKQLQFTDGYDHPFILKEKQQGIILTEEASGRKLTISTDQPAVVFYAGNQLEDEGRLSTGVKARKRLGVCLETQDYPNAVNLDRLPTQIYSPNNIYTARTEYEFKTT